jgi:hypothetical protein
MEQFGRATECRRLHLTLSASRIQLLLSSAQGMVLEFQQYTPIGSRSLQAYTDDRNIPLYGPAVTIVQIDDGSWMACVRIEHQIIAHHPAL